MVAKSIPKLNVQAYLRDIESEEGYWKRLLIIVREPGNQESV